MAQAKEFAEVYPVPVDGLNIPAPIVVPVSFETGEQGTYRVYTAGKIRINRVKAIVVKAIAGTDNGTVTVKDAAGDTIATLTAAASASLGTQYDSGSISDADQDISADSYFDLVTAKSTAGGKLLVSVEYSVLPVR
jgi:hypothetical protein